LDDGEIALLRAPEHAARGIQHHPGGVSYAEACCELCEETGAAAEIEEPRRGARGLAEHAGVGPEHRPVFLRLQGPELLVVPSGGAVVARAESPGIHVGAPYLAWQVPLNTLLARDATVSRG
jgi:hypothetical protein